MPATWRYGLMLAVISVGIVSSARSFHLKQPLPPTHFLARKGISRQEARQALIQIIKEWDHPILSRSLKKLQTRPSRGKSCGAKPGEWVYDPNKLSLHFHGEDGSSAFVVLRGEFIREANGQWKGVITNFQSFSVGRNAFVVTINALSPPAQAPARAASH
jgi:hypothetical protein